MRIQITGGPGICGINIYPGYYPIVVKSGFEMKIFFMPIFIFTFIFNFFLIVLCRE